MKIFCSAPRIIIIYITILSIIVIMSDAYEFEGDLQKDINTAQIKEGIEQYGFIVPCPAGTYAIIPWNSSGIPLGNPGLKGGLLFFDRDTIYFGK